MGSDDVKAPLMMNNSRFLKLIEGMLTARREQVSVSFVAGSKCTENALTSGGLLELKGRDKTFGYSYVISFPPRGAQLLLVVNSMTNLTVNKARL